MVFLLAWMFAIPPILSPTEPLGRGVLVVEGWLPDYTLEEAARAFESHSYRAIVATGIPLDHGAYILPETNYAQLASETLQRLGVKPESIVCLSCPKTPRNRTYGTALLVRRWLDSQSAKAGVDVYTLGVHARRTRFYYHLALGPKYKVGIIAGREQRFNPTFWFTTSSGVRTVTSEMIAYLYAKLVFSPSSREARESQLTIESTNQTGPQSN
jgi:hypothetical protein